MPPSSHVRVVARFRPLTPAEAGSPRCARPAEGGSAVAYGAEGPADGGAAAASGPRPPPSATFAFDAVLGEATTQGDAFAQVTDVVDGVLAGRSGSIIAYGPTGSGKTHTMFGGAGGGPDGEGVVGRAIARLGAGLSQAVAANAAASASPLAPPTPGLGPPSAAPSVTVSVVEVYCEKVRCLLSPAGSPEVSLVASGAADGSPGLAGAAAVAATSAAAVRALVAAGLAARAVGPTAANAHSSRSHCVVIVHVTTRDGRPARLVLADLAGSERAGKDGAGPGTVAFEEGRLINAALSALGNVVAALAAQGGAGAAPAPGAAHIPYRASKLTRLLQGAVGGRAATTFLVCASGAGSAAGPTLAALRFGARARGVVAGVMTDVEASVPGAGVKGEAAAALAAALAAARTAGGDAAAALAAAARAATALAAERQARAAFERRLAAVLASVAVVGTALVVVSLWAAAGDPTPRTHAGVSAALFAVGAWAGAAVV